MALPDLTGQNIEETYPRILQIDSGIIYDGTGSLVDTINVTSSYATTASYAISASHEIIKEVSSSYADTASFAQSGDGIFSGSFSGSFEGDITTNTSIESPLYLNQQIITTNQTVPGTNNGMLASPISVSQSITLDVESGATLLIL